MPILKLDNADQIRPAPLPPDVRVLGPHERGLNLRARELWSHRALVRFFGGRLLRKLYVRTRLGVAWIPLRAILDVGGRVILFGALLGAPSDGRPYFLFLLAGMCGWALLDRSLFWLVRSVELQRQVARRIYFPRIAMPLAAYLPAGLEVSMYLALFALATGVVGVFGGSVYLPLDTRLMLVPVALAMIAMLTFGVGLILAVLGAQSRDARFALGYVTQLWFFVSPVALPLGAMPEGWRTFAALNPAAAPIELLRKGLIGAGHAPPTAIASWATVTVVTACMGAWFFARSERAAVDKL